MAECFEFDCPRGYADLNQEYGESDLDWFSIAHLAHENSFFEQQSCSRDNEIMNITKTVVPLVHFTKQMVTNNRTKRRNEPGSIKIDQSPFKKKSRVPAEKKESEEKEMLVLLRKHNEKFTPKTKYEPSRHSVRDVRKWEKISGKEWSVLSHEERILANEEILRLKNK